MGSSQSVILSAHEHYHFNTPMPRAGGSLYLPSEILRVCHPDRCWCSCPGSHPPKRYICCEDSGSSSYSDAFDGLHRLMCGQLAFENVRSPREWPEAEYEVVQEVVEDYYEWTCGPSSHGRRSESPEAVELEMRLERFMRDVRNMMFSENRQKTSSKRSDKATWRSLGSRHLGSGGHPSSPQLVVMGQHVQVNLDYDKKNVSSKSRHDVPRKHRRREAPQMLVQGCHDIGSSEESTDSDSTLSHDSHTHHHHRSGRTSPIPRDWRPHRASHRKVRFSSTHASRTPPHAVEPNLFSSRPHHYDSGRSSPYHNDDHHTVYSTSYHSRGRTHDPDDDDDHPCRRRYDLGPNHDHRYGHARGQHDLRMSGGLGSCSPSSSRSRSRERMPPGRSVLKRCGPSRERERWLSSGC